jgi:hypothetical protein
LFELCAPAPSEPLSAGDSLGPFGAFLLILASAGAVLVALKILPSPITIAPKTERSGLGATALDQLERAVPVQLEGTYRYVLTPKEVFAVYEEARDLFTKYRDEAAKVALNRLLESNASDPIKRKARLLKEYMDVPGFDGLKDRFAYAEVMREPILYRDCYVIWQGMAANLELSENTTAFNFLVGYDMKKSALQGVVPVRFNLSASINTEKPLEILGKVIPISAEKGLEFMLEGVALHQSELRLGGDDR